MYILGEKRKTHHDIKGRYYRMLEDQEIFAALCLIPVIGDWSFNYRDTLFFF